MHPVTRLARVQQQLHSFAELHQAELEGLARELEGADLGELVSRLAAYQELHRHEAAMVVEELADLAQDVEALARGLETSKGPSKAEEARSSQPQVDPAASSPRRARWLAEQAERAKPRPVSRRGFLAPWNDGE